MFWSKNMQLKLTNITPSKFSKKYAIEINDEMLGYSCLTLLVNCL